MNELCGNGLCALALTRAVSLPSAHAVEGLDIAARFPTVCTNEGFSDVDEADWVRPLCLNML